MQVVEEREFCGSRVAEKPDGSPCSTQHHVGCDSFVWNSFAPERLESFADIQEKARDSIFMEKEELLLRCQQHLKYLVGISQVVWLLWPGACGLFGYGAC